MSQMGDTDFSQIEIKNIVDKLNPNQQDNTAQQIKTCRDWLIDYLRGNKLE